MLLPQNWQKLPPHKKGMDCVRNISPYMGWSNYRTYFNRAESTRGHQTTRGPPRCLGIVLLGVETLHLEKYSWKTKKNGSPGKVPCAPLRVPVHQPSSPFFKTSTLSPTFKPRSPTWWGLYSNIASAISTFDLLTRITLHHIESRSITSHFITLHLISSPSHHITPLHSAPHNATQRQAREVVFSHRLVENGWKCTLTVPKRDANRAAKSVHQNNSSKTQE